MIKQCRHCERKFDAKGSTVYCPRDECQEAKRELARQTSRDYYYLHKKSTSEFYTHLCRNCEKEFTNGAVRGNWCPEAACQKAKRLYYAAKNTPRDDSERAIHRSTNWTLYQEGVCINCLNKKQLNRFGLCNNCYTQISTENCMDWEVNVAEYNPLAGR